VVAVRSGGDDTGHWQRERRDVLAGYRRISGEDSGMADAVAIMTDTDNGGGIAAACYGDVWFTAVAPVRRRSGFIRTFTR
jgi:hypothetical protein